MMDSDKTTLEACKAAIEHKLCWPPSTQWRDFEFSELADRIFEASSVQLSTTTLKRLFGKIKYESLPSSTTLNAIAVYLGYKNWMEFQSSRTVTESSFVSHHVVPKRLMGRSNRKTIIAAFTILTLIAIMGFVFLSGSSTSSAIPFKNVSFSSKPLAKGLPNSVVFTVGLKNVHSDDLVIQQSWDSTRTVKLLPGQTTATGVYYIPGYFRARLLIDKKIIREHDLFIRSEGWMATVDNNPDPPTYVKAGELIFNNKMTVSENVIKKIRAIEEPVTLTYHLVQPFEGLSSNDFILNTSLRNTFNEGPAVCKTVKIFILCTKGAFIIPFTIPGCAGTINLKLNDLVLQGKSNDLSAFTTNPEENMKIRVESKNRNTAIYLNDKLVTTQAYNSDAGEIVGLRFSFLGAGEVDYVSFSSSSGKKFYDNRFTK